MVWKSFILLALLAITCAEPNEIIKPRHELMTQFNIPSLFNIVCDIIQKVISSKISAIGIAVHVIEWVISNFSVIAFGAIAVFGVCKLTNLCSVEKYVPLASFRSYATPERLETVERFLMTALDKYAEKKK